MMKEEEKALCELKMTVTDHHYKITKVEEQVSSLQASDSKQWTKLRGIKQTMTIVKWTAIGMAVASTGSAIGLGQIFKLLGV